MAKGRVYDDLYARLETKGEKELYRLARQRDRAGKDVQHDVQHEYLKNVNGKIQGRSKRATLCICGPREGLRQGSTGRAVVLYEKIRNSGKVCTTSTGYV